MKDDSEDSPQSPFEGIDWAGIDGVIGAHEPLAALLQSSAEQLKANQESATENATKLTESAAEEAKAEADKAAAQSDEEKPADPIAQALNRLRKHPASEDTTDTEGGSDSENDQDDDDSNDQGGVEPKGVAPVATPPIVTGPITEPATTHPVGSPIDTPAAQAEITSGSPQGTPQGVPQAPQPPPASETPHSAPQPQQTAPVHPPYQAYTQNPKGYAVALANWVAKQPASTTQPDWTEAYPPDPSLIGKKDADGDVYDLDQYLSDVRFWLSKQK